MYSTNLQMETTDVTFIAIARAMEYKIQLICLPTRLNENAHFSFSLYFTIIMPGSKHSARQNQPRKIMPRTSNLVVQLRSKYGSTQNLPKQTNRAKNRARPKSSSLHTRRKALSLNRARLFNGATTTRACSFSHVRACRR